MLVCGRTAFVDGYCSTVQGLLGAHATTYTHTHTHSHTHTQQQADTHTQTHTHTHTHTHTQTHTPHMQIHTHTHTYTHIHRSSSVNKSYPKREIRVGQNKSCDTLITLGMHMSHINNSRHACTPIPQPKKNTKNHTCEYTHTQTYEKNTHVHALHLK